MRLRLLLPLAVLILGTAGLLAAFAAFPKSAAAHDDPCHGAATCPADDHSYVWLDPATGQSWDCAAADSAAYDPTLDTTPFLWENTQYLCREVTPAAPVETSPPEPVPTSTTPTTAPTSTTDTSTSTSTSTTVTTTATDTVATTTSTPTATESSPPTTASTPTPPAATLPARPVVTEPAPIVETAPPTVAAQPEPSPSRRLRPRRTLAPLRPVAPLAPKAKRAKPPKAPEPKRSTPGVLPLPSAIPSNDIKPDLTAGPYVFPVYGPSSFIDTFGAARADVSWHHGDDIFAPLGAPLLAVANGIVFSVGWNDIGGNRLWLVDGQGNQFYYAHLSAFSPLAVNGRRVKAGDVLGFVGDSGDAAGTPYHVHFEIHPVDRLGLGYDGAVNPTSYLNAWKRVQDVRFAATSGWVPPAARGSATPAPQPGAILLQVSDISSASGLAPGSLQRALQAPVSGRGDAYADGALSTRAVPLPAG